MSQGPRLQSHSNAAPVRQVSPLNRSHAPCRSLSLPPLPQELARAITSHHQSHPPLFTRPLLPLPPAVGTLGGPPHQVGQQQVPSRPQVEKRPQRAEYQRMGGVREELNTLSLLSGRCYAPLCPCAQLDPCGHVSR